MKRVYIMVSACVLLLASCTTTVELKSDPNTALVEANVQLLKELKRTQDALVIVAEQNRLIADQNQMLKGQIGGLMAKREQIQTESH